MGFPCLLSFAFTCGAFLKKKKTLFHNLQNSRHKATEALFANEYESNFRLKAYLRR